MTSNFSVTPKPQNSNAKILMSVFFIVALVALVVSFFIEKYKGVVGMVTFASLITAILVYTKYIAVKFHYDIIVEEVDEPLFVVRQTIGKRDVTLCRIAFANITKIEKETSEERRAHKSAQGVAKYSYTPTLSPSTSYRIFVSSRYEKAEIIIEGTDELCEMLTSVAASAKANRISEDDE